MLYNAKNLKLEIKDTELNYVHFGKGKKTLILIPGLSLKGVKGAAFPLAYMYRLFAQDYTVYVFDKLTVIPDNYTIQNMASDIAVAMENLKLPSASVFGVSQGGMIAQYLAINYPQMVQKLVLGVTASKVNTTIKTVIENWINMAKNGTYEAIVLDMMDKMYSDLYIKKYKWMFPVLSKIGQLKDFSRFINLARACLTCNCYDELDKIKCPTFVLGGSLDKVVTGEASMEIAKKLSCKIHMYDNLGHAAYDEAKDFNSRIYEFLQSNNCNLQSNNCNLQSNNCK